MDCRVPEGRLTEVAERMADCRELPVEDPDDVRLRLMEDEIVDLVVTVNHRRPVFRLGRGEKTHLPSLAQPYTRRTAGAGGKTISSNLGIFPTGTCVSTSFVTACAASIADNVLICRL